jgi:hypothetical protein
VERYELGSGGEVLFSCQGFLSFLGARESTAQLVLVSVLGPAVRRCFSPERVSSEK